MKKTAKIFSTLFAASLTLGLLVVGSNSSNNVKAEKPAAAAEGEYVITGREFMAGLTSYTVGNTYLESNEIDGEYMVFDCRNTGDSKFTPMLHFDSGSVANNTWKELSKRATSIDFKFRVRNWLGGLTNCFLFVDGYAPNFTASQWFTPAQNVWNDSSTTSAGITFNKPADDANALTAMVINGAVEPGNGCCIDIKEVVFKGITNSEVAFSYDINDANNNLNNGVILTLKSAHGGSGPVNYAIGTEDRIFLNGQPFATQGGQLRSDHGGAYVWIRYPGITFADDYATIEIVKPTFFCNVLLPKCVIKLSPDGKWYYFGDENAKKPDTEFVAVTKKDGKAAYADDDVYSGSALASYGTAQYKNVEYTLRIDPTPGNAILDMHVKLDVKADGYYGANSGYLLRLNSTTKTLLLVEKASVVLNQKVSYVFPTVPFDVTLACYELPNSKDYLEVRVNNDVVLSHLRKRSASIIYGNDYDTFSGSSAVTGIGSSTLSEVTALNRFADKALHMSDYTEQLGWCKDSEHNYYSVAKTYYNTYLTANQQTVFMSSADYAAPRARLVAWAAANGESVNGTSLVKVATPFEAFAIEDSNIPTMIAVMSIVTALSFAALIIIKKKKHD